MSEPFLIIAALWTDGDRSAEVAKALHDFEEPEGFSRGAIATSC